MASNINPNGIDATYPIAGQDNDSQGFRTNFTVIKNNFTNAKTEIENLQNGTVKNNVDNNLGGTVIAGAEIKDIRETVESPSSSATTTITRSTAHYYNIEPTIDTALDFNGFNENDVMMRFKLEVTPGSAGITVSLPSGSTFYGLENIPGFVSGSTYDIVFASTTPRLFEFFTADNGTTYFVEEISGRDTIVEREITNSAGQEGDTPGMVAVHPDGDYVYFCTGNYDGSTAIWRRSSLSTF